MSGVTTLVLLFLVTKALSAVAYQVWLRPERRIARALSAVPGTDAATASSGMRKLVGRVDLAEAPLTAPMSGCPCIAYAFTVEEMRFAGWTPLYREVRSCRFTVDDGTGRALVEAGPHAHIALSTAGVEGKSTHGRRHKGLLEYLDRRGVCTESRLGFSKRLRFEESVLVPETMVVAAGPLTWEPDVEGERAGYRDVPGRLVMRGEPHAPVLVTDEPRATRRLTAPRELLALPRPPSG